MENIVPSFSVFLLIFVRISAFFVTMPLFSYRTIPAVHRIGLSFFLAWIMYYSVDTHPFAIDVNYYFLIIKEALIGLFIGFIGYLIMSAIQLAGSFIDFQMGFSIANVIDPQTGAQSPLMGQYLNLFSLLVLLSVNGHYMIIEGIFNSYHFIPLDKAWISFSDKNMLYYLTEIFGKVFLIAFQMAMPIVASLFLVDVALGIVARTVPQMNIFVVGFPIKIAVSFIILIVTMGAMFGVIQHLFETMFTAMRDIMEYLGGAK